ncbi:hypothetical protein TKK_0011844 [Trichogramma kaykai]
MATISHKPHGADEPCTLSYLLDKGIREELIIKLCHEGLNDANVKRLTTCGLTKNDIDEIRVIMNVNARSYSEGKDKDTASVHSFDAIREEAASFARKHFGHVLPAAIIEIVKKQPFEPINYLGKWLIEYADRVKREEEQRKFEAEIEERRRKCPENIEVTPSTSCGDLSFVDFNAGSEEEGREYEEESRVSSTIGKPDEAAAADDN